jgi:hypothetical protein
MYMVRVDTDDNVRDDSATEMMDNEPTSNCLEDLMLRKIFSSWLVKLKLPT